ncbi:MAG: hypothetical protein V1792_25415 [Pseudomonadota bacterium]
MTVTNFLLMIRAFLPKRPRRRHAWRRTSPDPALVDDGTYSAGNEKVVPRAFTAEEKRIKGQETPAPRNSSGKREVHGLQSA